MRVRTPRPAGGCHQCCTSPSTNCRAAARRRCSRASSGCGDHERHHVLELVAEAVGAARLVERRARPDAAGERLVEQPAVEQRCPCARSGVCTWTVPSTSSQCSLDRAQDARRRSGVAVALRSASRASLGVAASPRKKTISARSPGAQLDASSAARRRDRGRRRRARERLPGAERGRMVERAVAAEELRPVAGPRRLRGPPRSAKATRVPNSRAPRVAREQRAGLGIDLGHDERRRGAARRAEHPLDVGGHREPPRPPGRGSSA